MGAGRTGLFLRRGLGEANRVDCAEEIRAKAQCDDSAFHLHNFPTRWTALAYPNFSLVCGGQAVSQFSCMLSLVAALDAHGMLRSSSLALSGDGPDVTGGIPPVSIRLC